MLFIKLSMKYEMKEDIEMKLHHRTHCTGHSQVNFSKRYNFLRHLLCHYAVQPGQSQQYTLQKQTQTKTFYLVMSLIIITPS